MVTLQTSTLDDYRIDAGSEFETPCHVFLGGMNNAGYGQLPKPVEGTRMVHLAAWRTTHGEVPAGHQLDHGCRVRICRNVGHLQAVTPSENVRRRVPFSRPGQAPQRVHTGRLELGGTCQSGRHDVGLADIAARRCLACLEEGMRRSKARFRELSLAAQRGDWDTYRELERSTAVLTSAQRPDPLRT